MKNNNWRLARNTENLLAETSTRKSGMMSDRGTSVRRASGSTVVEAAPRVWVNTRTGVYHFPGTRAYGRSAEGMFLTTSQARRQGYKPSGLVETA